MDMQRVRRSGAAGGRVAAVLLLALLPGCARTAGSEDNNGNGNNGRPWPASLRTPRPAVGQPRAASPSC